MSDALDPQPPGRGYLLQRSRKRVVTAAATWRVFFRDLGMRFLVAASAVLVVAAIVWLLRLLG